MTWGAAATIAVLLALAGTLYFGLQSHDLWVQAQNSILGLM